MFIKLFSRLFRLQIPCLTLLLLTSCSPNSLEEFRREGESQCRALVLTLQSIETNEQLIRFEPILKNHFNKLVNLMIEARLYQVENPDYEALELSKNGVNDLLKEELRRIYTLEGGREIVERAQHEALIHLDAAERSIIKRSLDLFRN
jgi:hypothetical protein